MRGKIVDLTGQRYGRLLVLDRDGSYNGHVTWKCICDCGNYKIAVSSELRRKGRNGVKSCGCLSSEMSAKRIKERFPNPHCTDRLYSVWANMRNRCNNPKSKHYQDYGGRGISVCKEWENYEAFREWAITNGYDEKATRGSCTIDRIDVNGNYCPENCRWVDMMTQVHNRRCSRKEV